MASMSLGKYYSSAKFDPYFDMHDSSHVKLRLQMDLGHYSMYTFGVLMLLYTQKVRNAHETQFLTIFDIFFTDRPTDRPTYRGQMQKLLAKLNKYGSGHIKLRVQLDLGHMILLLCVVLGICVFENIYSNLTKNMGTMTTIMN